MELYNGNIYLLVWWYGKLMKLEDAPKQLSNKFYHKYAGKTLREYEWTVLRRFCQGMLQQLDKDFKRFIKKN